MTPKQPGPHPPSDPTDADRTAAEAADGLPAPPPRDPGAPRPGERIGAYRIVRRLGRGGMGEVFLAHDDRLGRLVAIKCIRQDKPLSSAQRQRFRREARAAARLNHPAIVQIFDLLEDDAGDAIVMEYVEGETLSARAARGPLDAALAARLGRDVALGLAAAHAAGLVHRDLKTENVMLTRGEEAKILDFGLAKSSLNDEPGEESLTADGMVLGTLHTMAPEQMRGGEADARSDLFALGVLLYELLSGRSPFRGSSRLDSLHKVLTEQPPKLSALRSGVPSELSAVVEHLLEKDPRRRPRSAREVAQALGEITRELAARDARDGRTVRDPFDSDGESTLEQIIGVLPTRAAVLPAGSPASPRPRPERSSPPPDGRSPGQPAEDPRTPDGLFWASPAGSAPAVGSEDPLPPDGLFWASPTGSTAGAGSLSPAQPPPGSRSPSGLSSAGPAGSAPGTADRASYSPPSSALTPLQRRPLGRWTLLAAAALAVLAAGAALLLVRRPEPPLRVVVARPVVKPAGDGALDLAGSGVLASTLSSLASLQGLAPVESPQPARSAASAVETARSAAAAEVLTSTLERQGQMGRLSLVRVAGGDGRVLWSRTFLVPIDPQDLRVLADAVAAQLRGAYPDHSLLPGVPDLVVREQDYVDYLRLAERIDSGEVRAGPELDRLEGIVRESPRFLEGYLLAAKIYENLFTTTRDPSYLDRAGSLARQAALLAPGDLRVLRRRFMLALDSRQSPEAERLLAEVASRQPGDPSVPVLHSQLAEQRGDLAGAVADMRKAVGWVPDWRNLSRLAELEAKNGEEGASRQHLEELLARSPRNLFALTQQAQREMLFGDLAHAEALYQDLQRIDQVHSHLSNLGLTQLLLGRSAEAAATFEKALAIDPRKISAIINLADAQIALGNRQRAGELYRQALAQLQDHPAADPPAHELMDEAQCLANLGRAREAVELARRALAKNPRDPQVLYEAALVYALSGDRAEALANARLALAGGMQPRWFTLYAFRSLRDDPELAPLIGRRPGAGR
jgi:serine/threonine protein kinase/tetratricopeptide (TPR) repeat protein